MKPGALVGGIQKFSTEDGPGIRTTVFLKGCPLRCKWCHNPELIETGQELMQSPGRCVGCGACVEICPVSCIKWEGNGIFIDRGACTGCMKCTAVCYAKGLSPVAAFLSPEEVMKAVEQDRDFYGSKGGLTISGGELLLHGDFVKRLIGLAEEKGIGVCLDTSGFGEEKLLLHLAGNPAVTDLLYDMKLIDSQKHWEYTGHSNDLILSNLETLSSIPEINGKIQMRMPLIRGVNDGLDIIERTCDFYESHRLKKVTLIPYHTLGISKMRNIGGTPAQFEPPSQKRVLEIQRRMEEKGMHVEVLGEVPEE